MAMVQRQFEEFHDTIKLGHYDENEVLREKRGRILARLEEGLKKLFSDMGKKPPSYSTFNQGSYAMNTGVKPLDDDFDIDVGVRFEIAKDEYPDPVEVKTWVFQALKGHTQRVEIRRPCVTVYYQQHGEPIYHVDLAIYSDGSSNPDGKTYLAKGKTNSNEANRYWEEADPQGLMALIASHFQDSDDARQFRRVIRYLKRWRDVKFPSDGNAAPIGIGITVAAYHWFSPQYSVTDPFSNARTYNDLLALQRFVQVMLNHFRLVPSEEGGQVDRLIVRLPVVPYNDLFERMTDKQMADFKVKLEDLLQALNDADEEADPVEACKILRKQFGDDFPVPTRPETGRKVPRAFISSSASA